MHWSYTICYQALEKLNWWYKWIFIGAAVYMTSTAHRNTTVSMPYSNQSSAYIRKASIILPSMCVITRFLKDFFAKDIHTRRNSKLNWKWWRCYHFQFLSLQTLIIIKDDSQVTGTELPWLWLINIYIHTCVGNISRTLL